MKLQNAGILWLSGAMFGWTMPDILSVGRTSLRMERPAMDTPHPNEIVKFCPQCGCKTWTDVDGKCEWSDMHHDTKRGGPTEQQPDRPTCKPDGSCCEFVCGN
jgi:hypothetical protein